MFPYLSPPDIARPGLPAWALALSLVLHAIVLWTWAPDMRPLELIAPGAASPEAPLVARLEPPALARPPERSEPVPAREPRPERQRPPPPAVRPLAPAPLIAVAPRLEVAPLTVPPPPPPQRLAERAPLPPAESDLSAYIDARRRERGGSQPSESSGTTRGPPSADEENARRDRAIAANIASVNSAVRGDAPKNSGGVFQVRRLGYDDAEFTFFGWYRDANRRMTQKVEVRRGAAPDIRIAVVRRMIEIIRRYEQEDFTWRSIRLARDLTLSARASDTAMLEAFLLREFFGIDAPQLAPAPL